MSEVGGGGGSRTSDDVRSLSVFFKEFRPLWKFVNGLASVLYQDMRKINFPKLNFFVGAFGQNFFLLRCFYDSCVCHTRMIHKYLLSEWLVVTGYSLIQRANT